jgi:hypothetical protein
VKPIGNSTGVHSPRWYGAAAAKKHARDEKDVPQQAGAAAPPRSSLAKASSGRVGRRGQVCRLGPVQPPILSLWGSGSLGRGRGFRQGGSSSRGACQEHAAHGLQNASCALQVQGGSATCQ